MNGEGMRALREGARTWGLELSTDQLQAFQAYYDELMAWNLRLSLTAITGCHQVQLRHFLDSLSCLLVLDARFPSDVPPRTVDVGTGAGFPGMVLKILRPEWDVTLVDSVRKKLRFVEHMVEILQCSGVTVLWARAEELGQDPAHREQYDVAVSRAVAELSVLAEYLLPLCRTGGVMVAPKGLNAKVEVEDAQRAVDVLGGQVTEVRKVDVPGLNEDRYLVVVDKIAPTPASYPRTSGIPSKRPLS